MEFDIAAERNGRDAPARAKTVDSGPKLRPEADREGVDSHAAPAADDEMAELVDEHDQRQDEHEGNEVDGEGRQKVQQSAVSPFSLAPSSPAARAMVTEALTCPKWHVRPRPSAIFL